MTKEEYNRAFAYKNSWAKEAIKEINPSGMTENEYNAAQARAMIKKQDREEAASSKEAYLFRLKP